MKSFLLKDKKPTVKWSLVSDEVYFEGEVPEGFSLAICPNAPYIILDVDKHGNLNGFDSIPPELCEELSKTLYYATKNNGAHYWFKYTGNKVLANKSSGIGLDLRTHKGYVRWYLPGDIRTFKHLVKESSENLNKWLESLFSYV